jgi:hypothetical protein
VKARSSSGLAAKRASRRTSVKLTAWIPVAPPSLAAYPAASGCQGCCGIRQSMPSSSIASCAASATPCRPWPAATRSALAPAASPTGRRPGPPARSLHQIAPAFPEHQEMPGERILPERCLGCAASVAKPLRTFVAPARSQTVVPLGARITTTWPAAAGRAPRDRSCRRSASGALRELDLDPTCAEDDAGRSPGSLTISTGRNGATSAPLSANRRSRRHVNTRLAFTSYRSATWLGRGAQQPRLRADQPLLLR